MNLLQTSRAFDVYSFLFTGSRPLVPVCGSRPTPRPPCPRGSERPAPSPPHGTAASPRRAGPTRASVSLGVRPRSGGPRGPCGHVADKGRLLVFQSPAFVREGGVRAACSTGGGGTRSPSRSLRLCPAPSVPVQTLHPGRSDECICSHCPSWVSRPAPSQEQARVRAGTCQLAVLGLACPQAPTSLSSVPWPLCPSLLHATSPGTGSRRHLSCPVSAPCLSSPWCLGGPLRDLRSLLV